jgi:glycosyltransferase involved in cell wall biosynthesis
VDVEQFDATRSREDFYLIVSELTPYKRVDLAIEAFRGFKGRLVIIGDGPEGKRLRGSAPSNVRFLGRQPFEEVKNHLELCRAFLNPQIEDFGITSVEALAAGAPVIAYRDGGALEIVEEERTGLFFDRQNSPTLKGCLMRFERTFHSDPLACRATVLKFCPERFRHQIMEFMSAVLSDVTPSPNNTGLN